jgi:hypothetical protein
MNKVLRAILIVLCFEMGALLLFLPWSSFWEQNYFLMHFPALMPILLHPSFRGIVSGLGILDFFAALSLIQPRASPSRVPHS